MSVRIPVEGDVIHLPYGMGVAGEHCPEDVLSDAHNGSKTPARRRASLVFSLHCPGRFRAVVVPPIRPAPEKQAGSPPGGGPQQDTVLLLSCLEAQKLRFQGDRTTPLRSVVLPAWGYKQFAGSVSAPPARLLPIMRLGNRPLPHVSEGIQRRRNLQGRSPQME